MSNLLNSDPQTLTIRVINKLDAPLVIDAADDLTVAENSLVLGGTTQLRVTTDEAGETSNVEYRLADDADNAFVDVSSDGVISLKKAFDYEALSQDEKENGISFAVEARYPPEAQPDQPDQQDDDNVGWQGKTTKIIKVTNKLDAPLAIDAVDDLTVAEGVASGTEVVQLSHSINEVGVDVTYRLVVEHDHFALSSNGRLTIKTPIDYETLSQDEKENGIALQIIARATRGDEQPLDSDPQTLTIRVINKLDAPLAIDAVDDLTVAENSLVLGGTTQLRVTTDELGETRNVEYRLADDADNAFVDVSSDGVISLKKAFDYEALSQDEKENGISFAVEARYPPEAQPDQPDQQDDDNVGWQGQKTLTIRVTNIDDHGPVFENLPPEFRANEVVDAQTSSPEFQIHASDADGDDVTYVLTGVSASGENETNNNRFVDLDLNSGKFKFKPGAFDYEAASFSDENGKYFLVKIRARSEHPEETETKKVAKEFKIYVDDIDEKPTAMDLTETVVTQDEGVTTARKLADIEFTDDALGDNKAETDEQEIDGHRLFEIRNNEIRNKWELWLKAGQKLDYENPDDRQHQIEIRPEVSGVGDDPAPQRFTLNVTNKLDEKPSLPALPAITIAENIADLGRVEGAACQSEEGASLSYHISGDNPHEITLSADGALSVDGGFDYEALSDAEKANGIALQIIARATRGEEELDSEPQTLTIRVTNKLDAPLVLDAALPCISPSPRISPIWGRGCARLSRFSLNEVHQP